MDILKLLGLKIDESYITPSLLDIIRKLIDIMESRDAYRISFDDDYIMSCLNEEDINSLSTQFKRFKVEDKVFVYNDDDYFIKQHNGVYFIEQGYYNSNKCDYPHIKINLDLH